MYHLYVLGNSMGTLSHHPFVDEIFPTKTIHFVGYPHLWTPPYAAPNGVFSLPGLAGTQNHHPVVTDVDAFSQARGLRATRQTLHQRAGKNLAKSIHLFLLEEILQFSRDQG